MASSCSLGAGYSGERDLQRTCTACHPLDVVRRQRLSREEWRIELEKMYSMGAKIRYPEALLKYLSSRYGEKRQPREKSGSVR